MKSGKGIKMAPWTDICVCSLLYRSKSMFPWRNVTYCFTSNYNFASSCFIPLHLLRKQWIQYHKSLSIKGMRSVWIYSKALHIYVIVNLVWLWCPSFNVFLLTLFFMSCLLIASSICTSLHPSPLLIMSSHDFWCAYHTSSSLIFLVQSY